VTGCNSQFLVSCEGRGTTVIMPAFNVHTFLKLIEAERINTLTSVPAVYWLAMNQPAFKDVNTKGVIRVSYGGAPIAPDLVGRIVEAFPNARVGNGFGLSECCSVATFLPHEYARTRPETVGFAAPVVDLKLGDVLPGNDVGELLIRGPNVGIGYWNKPEATAETFAGGWLHTGDMARLDDQGFVQIVDRKKDMVNRGGENVYCVEVENAISAHPAVFEVAVIGVPDRMMGEKVGAAVVLKPGVNADTAEILKFAREHLADFKVPQFMVLRSETLPRNPGGKILKKHLREQLEWGKQLW
jgi:acyl-CoA synthetase (AMP-forming)/AMP-acid ligase II